MINQENKANYNMQTTDQEDNFDLSKIIPFYLRNKKNILFINSIIFILSLFYGFTRKDIWQGEFQIVMKIENSKNNRLSSSLNQLGNLSNILNLNPTNSSISTEVEILKSPSVLNPVFEKVKNKKMSQGIDLKDLTLANWIQESFDIEIVDGTTVLNLAYRDTDKSQILPVLNQISKIYQDYSDRNRSKSIKNGIDYLEDQIKIYKEKASLALRDAQEFSSKYDLVRQSKGDANSDNEFDLNPLAIEEEKALAAEQIILTNQQILELKKLENDNDAFLFFTQQKIPKLSETGLPAILAQKDEALAFARAKYKSKDRAILSLEEEKKILMNMLKKRAYSYLNARKSSLEALENSLSRPEEVIIRFKELTRKLKRLNLTLINLENEHQLLQLEKAQNSEPWELITESTLLPNPVAPSRANIIFYGLVLGHLIAIFSLLIKENKEQIIYSSDDISKLLKYPLIFNWEASYNNDFLKTSFDLMAKNSLLNDKKSKISLFPIGDVEPDQVEIIKDLILDFSDDIKIQIVKKISELDFFDNQILILKNGKVSLRQINQFKENFKLINNNTKVGIIILNKDI